MTTMVVRMGLPVVAVAGRGRLSEEQERLLDEAVAGPLDPRRIYGERERARAAAEAAAAKANAASAPASGPATEPEPRTLDEVARRFYGGTL